ncbi:CPBP family intramembrane metalloprotease [Rossellomorea vietnamensis]|uniref:CPBP family intramembrane metalloprotease n=1 Tax=Rossellomorea vietnamensis TaxID=218284 RepID=A0A5D4MHT7_9BACI|nr:CPBP family intramembrane glutamic endopeptidase [Rossellomorea vietnamensis]TYS01222.1 CPBP family intramembrane metalloprotease [Rossellomorea vietnamensis]
MNLSLLKKTALLISLTAIAFLLEVIKLPELFLKEIPDPLRFKMENRIAVILFFMVLLVIFRKRYDYLFQVNVLKDKRTYAWIFSVLTSVYILMKASSGFQGPFLPFRVPELSLLYLLILLYRVCVLVPIAEEFLYRGLLLLVPSQRIRYVMLIVSSVFFASLHSNSFETIWLGLGLGILAIRFQNIWVPIIAHTLWNLMATYL